MENEEQQKPAIKDEDNNSQDWSQLRSHGLDNIEQEFHKIHLSAIFPLKTWWKDRPWNLIWVRWFMVFTLFPLCLLAYFGNREISFGGVAWAFGIYFSLMWLIILRFFMRPGHIPFSVFIKIVFFTVFIGIALVLLMQRMPIIKGIYRNTLSANITMRWFGFTFGVGFLEEAVKGFPILLFMYRKKQNYSAISFAFAGAVSGLAFGVAEAVSYSYLYANSLFSGSFGLGAYIVIQFLRLITLPLLHACFSSVVGYFIGLASMYQTAKNALILFGIFIAMAMHGTYNTFSNGWPGVVVASIVLLIFVSYVRSADLIQKELTNVIVET
jgi:protease PrsW